MKTEYQIKEEIKEIEKALNNDSITTNDYLIFTGWREALNFVIAKELDVPMEVQKKADKIAWNEYLHFGLKKINGGFSNAECISFEPGECGESDIYHFRITVGVCCGCENDWYNVFYEKILH